ncbi:MAG: 2-oxoglutarate ferredoxin oxidoreductase subunit alpha, partial [Saprospiraceae bacterium]|nr:2-oxoglutarate ferredoxin oxidoreductase subunit alpha [Saprospiraceae bacterium]
ASDILHGLAAYKRFGVKTFQAEDEIAAVCSAIGASFGGNLAVTGTSGPGLALKAEAIGLAMILEIPLVIVNVQRGGPSTGLPTKTEQADLLQAMYGRNGESPVPVVSTRSPGDCFYAAIEACRIALQHMTPVILLSDGYIANSSEPWKYPRAAEIPKIEVRQKKSLDSGEFLPYLRDEKLVREWAIPGTPGLAHRLGGLEKEANTGNVSYDPANHEYMVKIREERIEKIAEFVPAQEIESGPDQGDLLILGWGSTYGAIESVVRSLTSEGRSVSHAHIRYLKPFPRNLGELCSGYKEILVPELNNGQLAKLLRDKYLLPVHQYNKIQGMPITKAELKHAALQILDK